MRVRGLDIEIGKHKVPVTVSNEGEFWAEWEGDSYRSTTFAGLRKKLLPVVREDAKRVEVPALFRRYSNEFEPIMLIGIHADNGNVLYTNEEGKTQQLHGSDTRVYRPLSDDELAACARLERIVEKAKADLQEWLRARHLDAQDAVRQRMGLPKLRKKGQRPELDEFD